MAFASFGLSRQTQTTNEKRAANTDVPPITSHAIIVKLLAKTFITDSLGRVSCQFETASVKYGNDSENKKPTMKPTMAAMATALRLRERTSAVCCFINSTEFRFRWSLFINRKSEESSGSKFENKDFNLSSSWINWWITNRANDCGLAKDVVSLRLVMFPEFRQSL